MNLANEIMERMAAIYRCIPIDNGVTMNTHCLYPSNGMVKVTVFGAGTSYFVTDNGGAIHAAESAGAEIKNPDRMFSKALSKQGLNIKNGAIFSPGVGLENIAAAITIVANASKEISESIFDTWRISHARNFKDVVRNFLRYELQTNVKEDKISGRSNKPHTFENVVEFMNGSKLLVDAVLKDANSINSRFVANLDVHAKKYPNLKQRIVYDDSEDWQASDLSLLGDSGVLVIPFSKSESALREAISQP